MSSLNYHKPLRAITFICNATQANSVSIVGDFNQWNPAAHPMKQAPDRSWLLTVELKHGHHRFRVSCGWHTYPGSPGPGNHP